MPSYEHMDDDGDDTNATCGCGSGPFRVNIERVAYVVGFCGFAVNMLQAIFAFLPDSPTHHHNVSMGVLYVLGALIYLSIIVAQRERSPVLFLPYLIYLGMGLVAYAVGCIGLVVLIVAAPHSLIDEWNKEHPQYQITVEQFRIVLSFYLGLLGLGLAVNGWFYSLIYRAYKHLKHVLAQRSAMPPV